MCVKSTRHVDSIIPCGHEMHFDWILLKRFVRLNVLMCTSYSYIEWYYLLGIHLIYQLFFVWSTLALKPRAEVTGSSKQGHQWPRKKGLVSSNFVLKFAFTSSVHRMRTWWYFCHVEFSTNQSDVDTVELDSFEIIDSYKVKFHL